ncbi:MAG: hypothetical protein EBT86_00960 [Actinobacteria bacterium]|nr:hypothetical protein [Actinomycetota bacterium]
MQQQIDSGLNNLGFKRPGGDITTILNLTDRDSQDGYFFPLSGIPASRPTAPSPQVHVGDNNSIPTSWFFRGSEEATIRRTQILSTNIQEITQRGPASWGQRCTFEIGNMSIGDLLTNTVLQIRLGHWLPLNIISQLQRGAATYDPSGAIYTYGVSIGTSIIAYAEFEVADKTIERIPGEYIRAYLNLLNDQDTQFGIATDAVAVAPVTPYSTTGMFNPNRPWPTENGIIFCPLSFFFTRNLKQAFPILSTARNTVRIHIEFRPFNECIRSFSGFRSSCQEGPLGLEVQFLTDSGPVTVTTTTQPPDFQDCRLLVSTALCDGGIRSAYLRSPFEQMTDIVQWFHFDEPQKYIASKSLAAADQIEIQLPLELNNPLKEIFWFFRRKAVQINNEWGNFRPYVESDPQVVYPPWLVHGVLRFNGLEVISAEGDFFRHQICRRHEGGYAAWALQMYGYSFSRVPEDYQPNGTANASRCNTITLNLRVRVPKPCSAASTWAADVSQGWEVFVFAHGLNWLRFENGLCSPLFNS